MIWMKKCDLLWKNTSYDLDEKYMMTFFIYENIIYQNIGKKNIKEQL
jgi:hypothetical protein